MYRINSSEKSRYSAWLSGVAALGALMLASVPAHAQSPTGTSPTTPTPFSWPMYHSGGANTEAQSNSVYGQHQGTPTGLFTVPAATGYPAGLANQSVWTQIPSFLLGNYDTLNPPGGYTGTIIQNADKHNFKPNTFNQRNIAYWYAPFAYADAFAGALTVDNDQTTGTPAPYTQTGFSPNVSDTTATNTDYDSATTVASASPTATATWNFTVPASGNYSIVAHLPHVAPSAASGVTTDAHYVIDYNNGIQHVTVPLRKSQTSGGTITLISPLFISTAEAVVVTLDNGSANTTLGLKVFADSISLLNASGSTLIADEDDTKNLHPATSFAVTSPASWTTQSLPTSTIAGSASNGSYIRALATAPPITGATPTAVWTFKPTQTGLYNVSFHIPDSDNLSATDPAKEFRVTDAHYVITVAGTVVADLRKSQTESNGDEALAGPIVVHSGDTVNVTLSTDSNTIAAANAAKTYVVADTMSLTQTTAATVDGTPVVVNVTEYPDIANAKYVGVLPGTIATPDTNYRGNNAANPLPDHFIRQLVYFGRNENVVSGNTYKTVGTVYCVDGLTGGVVWRYTMPQIDTKSSAVSTSTAIHSTPAVAKFNVVTSSGVQNKLCVVVTDDGGHVICLDAVGNADGGTIDPTSNLDPYNILATPPPHIGTTNAYWIFRPDQNHVQTIDPTTGVQNNSATTTPTFDAARDMFAPLAFNTSSPTLVVDGSGNGTIYVGNSNGVLYALDATGVGAYDASGKDISPYLGSAHLLKPDLTDQVNKVKTIPDITTPTCKPLWWFSVSGSNAGNGAQIQSAPSVKVSDADSSKRTIYIGSSNELGGTSNYGRIYSVSQDGPTRAGVSTNYPGTPGYNTSLSDWEFPRGRQVDATHTVRPALGNITGSPVVFTVPVGTGASAWTGTYIYFAANTGEEIAAGTTVATRGDGDNGRIWCITPAGDTKWSYPTAVDPNSETPTVETTTPIGGFMHATPAMGIVEFPTNIQYGGPTAPKNYVHADAVNTDIKGKRIPMLYIGTAGSVDSAMYALDVQGASDTDRGVYRIASPDGSVFQSAPALLTNATAIGAPLGPGNGGMVYCTAGTTLYQFSATPLTNLDNDGAATPTYDPFAKIEVDAIFGNCGPVSSPSLGAANVLDLSPDVVAGGTNTTDWLYVGDTTTGLAKGLTPANQGGGFDITTIIPGQGPQQGNPELPANLSRQYTLHIHIMQATTAALTSKDVTANESAIGGDLPVFEWGDDVHIRVTNIVPANPGDTTANSNLRVPLSGIDPDPTLAGYYLTNGSPITLQVGDTGSTISANDNGLIPAITEDQSIVLPADGMYRRSDSSTVDLLKDAALKYWFGSYNYALRDGSGRLNTPGSTRRVTLARQTAEIRDSTGSIVGTVTLQSDLSQGVQPTFGILNPLGLNGYANSLTNPTVSADTIALPSGGLGPLTSVAQTAAASVQALANGNNIYSGALPKNGTTFGGSDPTQPGVDTTTGTAYANNYPTNYVQVSTATGELTHGSSGDNSDLSGLTSLPSNAKYLLNVADRSLTPQIGGSISVRMESSALHWNDPSTINGFAAIVNPLPWETPPVSYGAGANRSPDYPDIPRRGVSETLIHSTTGTQTDITQQRAAITDTQRFAPESIAVSVKAPKYQPANLTHPVFNGQPIADGYHTRVKIFVDTNQNGILDNGEAYREVDLQSGVLVDMSTSIANATSDIGTVPQGFGLQTDAYTGLGNFVPDGVPFNVGAPYLGNYGQFFRKLTIFNKGNTNLVNAMFDQRIDKVDTTGTTHTTLNLYADALDTSAGIPAFDTTNFTGTRPAGLAPYLVRTSLDPDLLSRTQNPLIKGNSLYPGATFHKARVGDAQDSLLTVPDKSPDDVVTATSLPKVSVAVPLGTPVGSYSQTLRLFEDTDTVYNWLNGPTYGGASAGHTAIGGGLQPTFALINTGNKYESVQPYSEPGTKVKVTVSEARLSGDKIFGDLPLIDDVPASPAAPPYTAANYAPSAYRDLFWSGSAGNATPSGSGSVQLAWTSTRSKLAAGTGPAAASYSATLPFTSSGAFMPSAAGSSWLSAPSILTGATPGINVGYSVAVEPHVYDDGNDLFSSSGERYGFYSNLNGSQTDLFCVPYVGGVAQLPGVDITQNDHTSAKFGVKGLKAPSNTRFVSPTDSATISNDLWAFWYTGSRGGSSIQYNSAITSGGSVGKNDWTNPATLPVPAGLVSVSEPYPTFLPGTSQAVSWIQVTYTGVAPDGNADIYSSVYRPFHPYKADPANPTNTIADTSRIALALLPFSVTEYLQPDAASLWWQARDVAWVRNGFDINKPGNSIVVNGTAATQPAGPTSTYDKASGLTVFTGVSVNSQTNVTVYVDTARGRVRFRPALIARQDGTGATRTPSVVVSFSTQARRITVDKRADTTPVVVLDEAYKPNEAAAGGAPRVSTGRMWYFWRKSGGTGSNTTPTLYYKTQRLTIQLHDPSGKPVTLALNSQGQPILKVYHIKPDFGDNQVFYDTTTYGPIDVDWKRGRLYFPRMISRTGSSYDGFSWENESVRIDFSYYDKSTQTIQSQTVSFTSPQWIDEESSTDTNATDSTSSTAGANTTGEHAVPMTTPVNESNLTAFLNPTVYADVFAGAYKLPWNTQAQGPYPDQPHDLWLFWTSNRNGPGDLYSTAVNPKFSADTP